MSASPSAKRHEYTVAVTRLLDAPRERVFECWTQAAHLAHWFGPQGFSIHSCETDPRPGGVFRLCMRSPEGVDYWVHGAYREVVAPERLVVHCCADDAKGVKRLDEVIIVTFASEGGRTRLTLHATAAGSGDVAGRMLEGMEQGWSETLERLRGRSNSIR